MERRFALGLAGALASIALPVWLVLASVPAHAAGPWYVAPSRSDSNDCLSPGAACVTINGAIGKASSGDTILVAMGTYTGTGTNVVLVNKSVTLSGGWDGSFIAQSGMSTIDGQNARTGITVDFNAVLQMDRFVVQHGYSSGYGGGIFNNGGFLALNHSVIVSNTALSNGAGIFNFQLGNSGVMTITNSTISGNVGGGIGNYSAKANSIINSTIVNNIAGNYPQFGSGGGIYNFDVLYLYNTTVAFNTGIVGGGIYNDNFDTVSIQNSIVANNYASSSGSDCRGTITTTGYNMIGTTSGCTFTPGTGDQTNISAGVSPLQDNGGATQTSAL
jgi:hypothetical protein